MATDDKKKKKKKPQLSAYGAAPNPDIISTALGAGLAPAIASALAQRQARQAGVDQTLDSALAQANTFNPMQPQNYNTRTEGDAFWADQAIRQHVARQAGRQQAASTVDQLLARPRSNNPLPPGLRGPDDIGARMMRLPPGPQEAMPTFGADQGNSLRALAGGLQGAARESTTIPKRTLQNSGMDFGGLQAAKWGPTENPMTYQDYVKAARAQIDARKAGVPITDDMRLPALEHTGQSYFADGTVGTAHEVRKKDLRNAIDREKARKSSPEAVAAHQRVLAQRGMQQMGSNVDQFGPLAVILHQLQQNGGQMTPEMALMMGGPDAQRNVIAQQQGNNELNMANNDRVLAARMLAGGAQLTPEMQKWAEGAILGNGQQGGIPQLASELQMAVEVAKAAESFEQFKISAQATGMTDEQIIQAWKIAHGEDPNAPGAFSGLWGAIKEAGRIAGSAFGLGPPPQ